MSARTRPSRSRKKNELFYSYCIGNKAELEPLLAGKPPEGVQSGNPLKLVTCGRIAAVVSVVSVDQFGEQSFPEKMADAVWLAERALSHQSVVDYFATKADILPLRFGTIHLSESRLKKVLSKKKADIDSFLKAAAGRREWGVDLFVDTSKLHKQVSGASPLLKSLKKQAEKSSPGHGYLMRKRIETASRQEVRKEVLKIVRDVQKELLAIAGNGKRVRVPAGQLELEPDLAARLVFLVPQSSLRRFRAKAEKMAEKYLGSGLRIELSGPWPPYNFSPA
ncbi:MAG: GvpL/GvpF family gas vesicle protein [Acidobacteria bacterium]|nr:GvpL/GvpF family gas vesicle protein [Acidobacteriota bacterium]